MWHKKCGHVACHGMKPVAYNPKYKCFFGGMPSFWIMKKISYYEGNATSRRSGIDTASYFHAASRRNLQQRGVRRHFTPRRRRGGVILRLTPLLRMTNRKSGHFWSPKIFQQCRVWLSISYWTLYYPLLYKVSAIFVKRQKKWAIHWKIKRLL